MIGPVDFDPYRAEFTDCCCPTCREVDYALSDVLDFTGRRHLAACEALLAALRAGTHDRVERADWHEQCRREHDDRVAAAKAAGITGRRLADIERGYSAVRMSDFYTTGMGLGMTPGGVGGTVRDRRPPP